MTSPISICFFQKDDMGCYPTRDAGRSAAWTKRRNAPPVGRGPGLAGAVSATRRRCDLTRRKINFRSGRLALLRSRTLPHEKTPVMGTAANEENDPGTDGFQGDQPQFQAGQPL